MTDTTSELVQFFKALADETRLRIVGLLAQESFSGEQLAAIMAVKPATISHHLSKLNEAGLVSAVQDGHARLYSLRLDAIHSMAQRLLAEETLPQTTEALDVEAYDRKVIRDFSKRDGSLKKLPAQEKKFQALLRHIVKEFDMDRQYTEKQVSEIMARFHADTASLRRGLIEYKLMQRAEGKYWRL
ncbi:MAG: metalloregulator ArsR/SmtB family transcription factor [Chloroflexota bacterium]